MKSMIEAINIKKQYNGFTAVDGISFKIKKGEIYGFLGPNGAGKTTTINMLIGLAKITSGKVCYDGIDRTDKIKKAQRIIGVVPDESNLYDEMTGYENLCFCGALYGMTKAERSSGAVKLLNEFGLIDVSSKKVKGYSKGMKRKLTIAASLIHQPSILFLDEPTTGIDVLTVRQIRNMITRLNEEGTTIFLTTHYIEEAERVCHRVAFINKGKIIREDTVAGLLKETQNSNVIDIAYAQLSGSKDDLIKKIHNRFPDITAGFIEDTHIRVISNEEIDISPVVNLLSTEGVFIYEAKLIKPSLEEAFVKITGIEIKLMKKEKERK